MDVILDDVPTVPVPRGPGRGSHQAPTGVHCQPLTTGSRLLVVTQIGRWDSTLPCLPCLHASSAHVGLALCPLPCHGWMGPRVLQWTQPLPPTLWTKYACLWRHGTSAVRCGWCCPVCLLLGPRQSSGCTPCGHALQTSHCIAQGRRTCPDPPICPYAGWALSVPGTPCQGPYLGNYPIQGIDMIQMIPPCMPCMHAIRLWASG